MDTPVKNLEQHVVFLYHLFYILVQLREKFFGGDSPNGTQVLFSGSAIRGHSWPTQGAKN